MAKNFIARGGIIEYANSGSAIAAGDVVRLGEQKFGVALEDIPATSGKGSVQIEGVFSLPKIAATAFTQGAILYWDVTALELSDSATNGDDEDNIRIGMAFKAAGSSDTTAQCKLFKDSVLNPA